jgi:hypothetical protein
MAISLCMLAFWPFYGSSYSCKPKSKNPGGGRLCALRGLTWHSECRGGPCFHGLRSTDPVPGLWNRLLPLRLGLKPEEASLAPLGAVAAPTARRGAAVGRAPMPANTIYYSDKYYDDTFEYRCACSLALLITPPLRNPFPLTNASKPVPDLRTTQTCDPPSGHREEFTEAPALGERVAPAGRSAVSRLGGAPAFLDAHPLTWPACFRPLAPPPA